MFSWAGEDQMVVLAGIHVQRARSGRPKACLPRPRVKLAAPKHGARIARSDRGRQHLKPTVYLPSEAVPKA